VTLADCFTSTNHVETCTEKIIKIKEICNNGIDDNANGQTDQNDPACQDTDNDGILNQEDNCPKKANPDQKDTDRDGIGDVCEETETEN
jgi:hypothetical protein